MHRCDGNAEVVFNEWRCRATAYGRASIFSLMLLAACGGKADPPAAPICGTEAICPGSAGEGAFYGCLSRGSDYQWTPVVAGEKPPCSGVVEVYRCQCAGNERVLWWYWPPIAAAQNTCASIRAAWLAQSDAQCH